MEIAEKKLKEILKGERQEFQKHMDTMMIKQRVEFQDYVGALSEHFQSQTQAVAEQYSDIKRTLDLHTEILDSHTEILDSHTEILDSHTEILDSHTEILDSHTEKFDSHAEMIASLVEDVSILKEDMKTVKTDVKIIKGDLNKKVDRKDFIILENRLMALEVGSRMRG